MCRLKRVFHEGELKGLIELNENSSRKLKTVLRIKNGEKIEIQSYSHIAIGEISTIGKRNIIVKINSIRDIIKPNYCLTVYQCIAKREYMDNIIEKYAELGVTKVIPVVSIRSLQSLKENTLERFKLISIDAALQSENEFITEITESVKLERINCNSDNKILFHERVGDRAIPKIDSKNVSIIIGPEGGFTDKETEILISKGFKCYTPLDCILKAETAAILFAGMVRLSL